MKRIILGLMVITNALIVAEGIRKGPAGLPAPQKRQNLYNESIRKASSETARFKSSFNTKDMRDARAYLGYYRSWYQSVTPMPEKLKNNISARTKRFVNAIKNLGDKFSLTKKDLQGNPGESRLSPDGEMFYQAVLKQLDEFPLSN